MSKNRATDTNLADLPAVVGHTEETLREAVAAEEQAQLPQVGERTYRTLDAQVEVRKTGDGKKLYRFFGTTEDVDSYNTMFLVDGWDFARFQRNPVILWSHNLDMAVPGFPIGKARKISRTTVPAHGSEDRAGGKKTKAWAFDVEFVQDDRHPFAGLVENMVEQGFLRAVSVGFEPKKLRRVSDSKELAKHGFRSDLPAVVFEETELLELSVVPVPSNPNALVDGLRAAVPTPMLKVLDGAPAEPSEAWVVEKLDEIRQLFDAAQTPEPEPEPLVEDETGATVLEQVEMLEVETPAVEPTDEELDALDDQIVAAAQAQPDDRAEEPCFECDLARELRVRCSQHGEVVFTDDERPEAVNKTEETHELRQRVATLEAQVAELLARPRSGGTRRGAEPTEGRDYVELVLGDVRETLKLSRALVR